MTVHHNNVSKGKGNFTNSKLIKTDILNCYKSGVYDPWTFSKPFEPFIGGIFTINPHFISCIWIGFVVYKFSLLIIIVKKEVLRLGIVNRFNRNIWKILNIRMI